jgi:hypothetical protein
MRQGVLPSTCSAAIIHDDLPTVVGAMADITDGWWSIGTLRRSKAR